MRTSLLGYVRPDVMPREEMKWPLIRGRGVGSRPLEALISDPATPVVGVLGTGDFSRSLSGRLVASGYQVVVGSRSPKRSRALFPEEAEVTSQKEAASQAGVVFVALFPEHYSTLAGLRQVLAGKVLVDVSNAVQFNLCRTSHAEQLADMFPESHVVKGFNTVSAWALQTGPRDGNRQVMLCGDSAEAKAVVGGLCCALGFAPVDTGLLAAQALDLENLPLRLFPSWRVPVLSTLGLFVVFYLYNFLRDVLHPFVALGRAPAFYKLPVETVNATLPAVALVTLASVYAPGSLAAGLQLSRGTKYARFPSWLDRWMGRRKQLGLCSFACAAIHAVYSLCLPMRRSARYKMLNDAFKQVKEGVADSWQEDEVWRMELYLSTGIMALCLLSLLAIASLPSVADALNWREFTFVQSGLGLAALTMATLHTLLFGWDRAFDPGQYRLCLPPTFMVALALPLAVLCSRLALSLPCLAAPLARIRRGWERSRHLRFSLPVEEGGAVGNGRSLEDISNV
ncbi:metalloreductase STEAP3-like isoform X2 [Gadus macrocephalus]|uniref:metalloreductase STEAP3-like isoform X2 n=1 Tax=Gadus macrocephalus TaxID=80720 RepID=UPI0028CB7320|nr:metalloreductase STEAP3-like isoform X2 [Gadus macrocephalus]